MDDAGEYGTDAEGKRSSLYCHFCYQKGKFTDAKITMEQMIEKVSGFMAREMRMAEDEAKAKAKEFIPKLKRWQKK
jgi:hypothetical protein